MGKFGIKSIYILWTSLIQQNDYTPKNKLFCNVHAAVVDFLVEKPFDYGWLAMNIRVFVWKEDVKKLKTFTL